ncbi:MAG: helix-turn-helix domain-containing protein, partial [Nitrospirae bacterium]|nr:helix-turn-helix domain-containing protein [Nitrospirota bacterium]
MATSKVSAVSAHNQERILNRQLEECRWLYNHFLEQRRDSWKQDGVSLSLYDQIKTLPSLKNERPSLGTVYS